MSMKSGIRVGIPLDGRPMVAVEFISDDDSRWFIELAPEHAIQLAQQLTDAALLASDQSGKVQ